MKFSEVVSQAVELLRTRGRVSYRALQREFELEDTDLEDLKEELLFAYPQVRDEGGRGLVWSEEEKSSVIAQSQQSGASFSPPAPSVPPVPPSEDRSPTGERRQLTVMFCDLVGSTALSEQLDPEDLHAMIRAYQAACGQIIEQYDGTIAQYLGDGLLVYFGYPAAHEDDARRAVRAGLDILKHITQLPTAMPLQVRIGVHTGPVVVGEIGQGGKREQLALGETPNIAARVQSQAEPNTLVISASSYRLVQGFFAYQDLGQHQLKGISIPVTLYQVQGEGTAQSHFEVSLQRGLTPLVGREEEVDLLQRRWGRAAAGEGQVVLISGEAGIGKSRLLQVLKDDIVQEEHWGIEAGCSPFYQNTALHPVIDQLQRLLLFGREDTVTEKRDKLANVLSSVGLASGESLALVANLLSIPAVEGQEPLNLSAQKQKEKTLEVLVTWVQREAERQPVLLVVEDLHWADPSTLELLRLLIERVSTARILVVLTFRPEFSPPWPMRGYLSTLTLSRLLHQQVELMASRVAGEKALPKELINQLVEKTDGVPLFVEEITKSILESDALHERADHYELIGPLADFHIPSTLQDSLMARLDRLNIAREIAQFGAVLGREFSYELLHATAGIDEDRLQHGLTQLIEAELAYVQGFPPEARYTFKHALVQDAAYQSLLKSTRREQHQRVATVLIERFAETTERQPELLAYHYTEAGLTEQAVPCWQRAAQKAAERSAYTEALSHIRTGLDLLATLPDTSKRA